MATKYKHSAVEMHRVSDGNKLLKCQPDETQGFPLISGQLRSAELCRRFGEVSSSEVNKLRCSICSKNNEKNMGLMDTHAVPMLFFFVCEGILL